MVYDTSKIFINNICRKFKNLSGIPSGSVALFALSDVSLSLSSFLQAGGKSKLKEHGKTFSSMFTTLGWFL